MSDAYSFACKLSNFNKGKVCLQRDWLLGHLSHQRKHHMYTIPIYVINEQGKVAGVTCEPENLEEDLSELEGYVKINPIEKV